MFGVNDVFAQMQAEQNEIQLISENETIIIDAEQRIIVIPESESLFGVKFDKDVERKYFQCPKIVGDNIDLSQCQIYITYVAVTSQNQQYPETGVGLYNCDDVEISGDNITFSWKLSGNVFAQEGYIAFKVVAKQSIGGELSTRWNTVPAFGTILNTISDGEDIEEQYPDIINQLLTKMESVEQIATPEAMQSYVDNYLEENPVTGGMTEEQKEQLIQNTSEIQGIRVGYNGTQYETAGEAVRAQISLLFGEISDVSKINLNWVSGACGIGGNRVVDFLENDTRIRTADSTEESITIPVDGIEVVVNGGYQWAYYLINEDGQIDPSYTPYYISESKKILPVGDYNKVIFVIKRNDEATIDIGEGENVIIRGYKVGGRIYNIEERVENIDNKINGIENNNKITLPFETPIEIDVYKIVENYYTTFNARNNIINNQNGKIVYISPTGSDENNGTNNLNPKKTIEEALNIEEIQTIIMMGGVYVAGTNFENGLVIDKEINIIGLGNVEIDNNGDLQPITFTNNVYVENISFTKGENTVITELPSSEYKATFNKCKFHHSSSLNGLAIRGGLSYIVDCVAHDNAYDGFNYHMHTLSGAVGHAVEINCKSYGNGTKNLYESDGYSSNATTSHDGNSIIRINGDYKCCYGGVVADKECKSANYGCSSGFSTINGENVPEDRKSNYWSSGAVMYLYDCISCGSKYDIATILSGKIISNIDYKSKYIG